MTVGIREHRLHVDDARAARHVVGPVSSRVGLAWPAKARQGVARALLGKHCLSSLS